MCFSFLFGFGDGKCDSIVLISDHCLSIYIKEVYTPTGVTVSQESYGNPMAIEHTDIFISVCI